MMRHGLAGLMAISAVAAAVSCGHDDTAFLGTSSTSGTGASNGGDCTSDRDCDAAAEVCEQGTCIPSHCVDGATTADESDIDCGGACLPCDNGKACSAAGDCASKFCDAETCAACTDNEDCGGGTFCEDGVCEGQKAIGQVCVHGAECESGYCPEQDGVCCDQRCDSGCEACAADKTGLSEGVCGPVVADSDPDAECSDQGAESCGANGTGCNGDALAPSCNVYDGTTECAPLGCHDGAFSAARLCDGMGSCGPGAPQSCAPFVCSAQGDACLATCASDEDCDSAHYCAAPTCLPKKQDGDGCSVDSQCQSGFCPAQDLICCDAQCGSMCESCLSSKTGGSNGTCGPISGGTDPDDECTIPPNCNGNGACGL